MLPADAPAQAEATAQAKQSVDKLQHSPRARVETRTQVAEYLDLPSALAGVLMVMLIGLQFSGKVQPAWDNPAAELLWILWGLFIAEFVLKLLLSPDKRDYLDTHRRHVLVAVVPPLGIIRLVRPLRTMLIAFIHLLLPTSAASGPYIAALKKRGLGRLALISAVVILIGGTAEYFFEAGAPGSPINNFGAAVWWSAATATTVANQLYPVTTGGEIVAFLIMVYAVCVFGYLASSLASVFVAGDAKQAAASEGDDSHDHPQPPERDGTLRLTDREVQVLRAILARLEH